MTVAFPNHGWWEDHWIVTQWFTYSLGKYYWAHTMFHPMYSAGGRKTNRRSHKTGKFQCFKYSHGISTRDLGISGLPLNLPGEWGVLPSTYFDPRRQASSTPLRTKTASLPVTPPFLMQPRTRPAQHLRVKRHLTFIEQVKGHSCNMPSAMSGSRTTVWWGATGSCPPWAPIYWRLAPR